MDTYNGYTNQATWIVSLWIYNDYYALEEELIELVYDHRDDSFSVGEKIRDYFEQYQEDLNLIPTTGMEADIFQSAWRTVDWRQIGDNILEGLTEEDEDEEMVR